MSNQNGNGEHDVEVFSHKTMVVVLMMGMAAWGLGAGVLIHQRHEYRKIRYAYEQALGAFVVSRVKVANAAELESLKRAIEQSQPVVNMVEDSKIYHVDGSTEVLKGKSPVTDFGIYRKEDGTWMAGSPTVNKK